MKERYLIALAAGSVIWLALLLIPAWLVDPYGVSPIRIDHDRINKVLPRRVNIDRQLKPFEVWRYQPRTLFLGTSRIHQGFDPQVWVQLTGDSAYNAAIPASSVELNLIHLRRYLDLNRETRRVIVELFFYNFIGADDWKPEAPEYLLDAVSLLGSADLVEAAMTTVAHNMRGRGPVYQIASGGQFTYPHGHDALPTFDAFPGGVWRLQEKRVGGFVPKESAFAAIAEMVSIAKDRGVELLFVLTPNHAYDDCFIEMEHQWPLVQQWLTRLTRMAPIYSFSQPNRWTYETPGHEMQYWFDPYHFTPAVGNAMQSAMLGRSLPDLPENFFVKLTSEQVAGHVNDRRTAIRQWMQEHPAFIAELERTRTEWSAGRLLQR